MKAKLKLKISVTPVNPSVQRAIRALRALTDATMPMTTMVVSPVVTPRAADFIALAEAQADCTPRGRHRAQAIRDRQHMVLAGVRAQPEAHGYAI